MTSLASALPLDADRPIPVDSAESARNLVLRLADTMDKLLEVVEAETEIVRTGTPVNSAVNLEVLGTIFYEGTPLHDGAAIIENGRIKAAGCVLPPQAASDTKSATTSIKILSFFISSLLRYKFILLN